MNTFLFKGSQFYEDEDNAPSSLSWTPTAGNLRSSFPIYFGKEEEGGSSVELKKRPKMKTLCAEVFWDC